MPAGGFQQWPFGNDLLNNRFVLFGENHGYAAPHTTDVALFTYLNKTAGFRHYIAEVDATKAWMLNRFLADGDTAWLQKVFASWVRDTAQWANVETYNKYRSLQELYKQLPPQKRFSFVGIDVPQDYGLLLEHILALTANVSFGAFSRYVDSLKAVTNGLTYAARKELSDYAKRMLPAATPYTKSLKKSLGKRHNDFMHLLTSFTHLNAGMPRDSVMYRNFKSQSSLNGWQTAKFYGYLGYTHCLQTGYNKMKPFAALLKTHEGLTGKIASLQMVILKSKSMLPNVPMLRAIMPAPARSAATQPGFPTDGRYLAFDLNNDNKMIMYSDGIEWLREISKPGSVTVFRLASAGSPFNKSNRLAQVSGAQPLRLTEPKNVTTDAFQYVVLFRGSPAATPL